VAYCREVKPLTGQPLNKLKSLEIIIGVISLAAPSLWCDYAVSFPNPDGLRMYLKQFGDYSYGINRPV